jgi:hypothetical protein
MSDFFIQKLVFLIRQAASVTYQITTQESRFLSLAANNGNKIYLSSFGEVTVAHLSAIFPSSIRHSTNP